MSLAAGTRLGPYEIVAPAGAGGMGEVYQAKDVRLGRTVAVKVLPNHLASTPDRKQRFEREARAISRLSHPHICTLYDVGNESGTDYLVMEYIEGETLASRLKRGPLPVKEALAFAAQIADALGAAHRGGVVHRDLKPGNVMLTSSGAKLLDFGLAKAVFGAGDAESEAPTKAGSITEEGVLAGTLAYMAPEQLEGKRADHRSDVFAFGVVLYEMVTARKPFEGASPASLIAAILEHEPPSLTGAVPPLLERVLGTCLRKDPEERFQSASDLRTALRWIEQPTAGAVESSRRRWLWPAVAASLATALAASIGLRPDPELEIREFAILPPPGYAFGSDYLERKSFALSPDGARLAFVTLNEKAVAELWIRELGSSSARRVRESDGAVLPFWSPSSNEVGFFDNDDYAIKRVGISGGVPEVIGRSSGQPRGATWGEGDVIVFAFGNGVLHRLDLSNDESDPVTELDGEAMESEHTWPQFLPDGENFVFFVRSPVDGRTGVYLGNLAGEKRFLLSSDSSAIFVPPGYLLFRRDGGVRAQRFDVASLSLAGESLSLSTDVEVNRFSQLAASASEIGTLVFSSGGKREQLFWYTRDGERLNSLGPPGDHYSFRISPDGSDVAVSVTQVNGDGDIWLLNSDGGVPLRVTTSPAPDFNAMWSDDGRHLFFTSRRTGRNALFRIPASGGVAELLFTPREGGPIREVTEAHGTVVVEQDGGLFAYPLSGEDGWSLAEQGSGSVWLDLVSPNNRWLAYYGNETGRDEVYVTSFPIAGRRWPISKKGGSLPRWSADGTNLFFVGADGRLYAVPVVTDAETFSAGEPTARFDLDGATHYDVSPDGQRILVNVPLPEPPELNVIMDWTTTLPP